MSTETALLVAIIELRKDLADRLEALQRQLELVASRLGGVPDRLSTREAARYAGVSSDTLYAWRDRGRLTYHEGPRPWSRVELDAALAGAPRSNEVRGRRRVEVNR